MSALLPGEDERVVAQESAADGARWTCLITSKIIRAVGTGSNERAAVRQAEDCYERARRELMQVGEQAPPEQLLDAVADCLRLHQHALSQGGRLGNHDLPSWSALAEAQREVWRQKARFYFGWREGNGERPIRGYDDRGAASVEQTSRPVADLGGDATADRARV